MPPERMLSMERIVIPISLVASMILSSIGMTWYLGARIAGIEYRVEMISRDLRDAASHAQLALLRREFAAWIQTQQAKGIQLTDLPPR